MIVTESMTISGVGYIRTYSDAGYFISREGILYEDAIDPADSGRVYEETDIKIPAPPAPPAPPTRD